MFKLSSRKRTAALILVLANLLACSGHDSDYIPYDLKGMNSYVYDEAGREHFAGYSEGGYFDREDVLRACGDNARSKAHQLGIIADDWGYVCCTVTADSSCATKLR